MRRSVPPRTMRDVSRKRRMSMPSRTTSSIGLGSGSLQSRQGRPSSGPRETEFQTGFFKKPRNWRFQTKPLFKKIKGPLVDVFLEAEEVLIVIDLGGFRRGDVSLTMTPERYSIFARREDQEFREEIELPPQVDIENCVEYFRNGVLEIILPRKKETEGAIKK